MALDGCMAGWHRVGPLRGLLLNPVTLRDESRRWEDDAAGGGGGARQQGSRRHCVMKNWTAVLRMERIAGQTSQGPFGSPLPRRCTCRRGASWFCPARTGARARAGAGADYIYFITTRLARASSSRGEDSKGMGRKYTALPNQAATPRTLKVWVHSTMWSQSIVWSQLVRLTAGLWSTKPWRHRD